MLEEILLSNNQLEITITNDFHICLDHVLIDKNLDVIIY